MVLLDPSANDSYYSIKVAGGLLAMVAGRSLRFLAASSRRRRFSLLLGVV